MPRVLRLASFAFAFAVAAAISACSPAPTGGTGITVDDAWTNATPPGATVGAGYMTIRNGDDAPARLTGVASSAAERAEIHAMSMENGVMSMRPVERGLEIPAGGSVELKPSGLHLMLIGLKQPLAEGTTVPVTLVFESGERVDVVLAVRAIGGGHGQ
jgi:periplasmic copper chaperone A